MTRTTPASTRASAQGAVRPVWAQGSRVTTAVPPRARTPAAARATTSAWGPPAACVAPSPVSAPVASRITAPTAGLGLVRPRTVSASASARCMAARSASLTCTCFLVPTSLATRNAGGHRRPSLAAKHLDRFRRISGAVDRAPGYEHVGTGLGGRDDRVLGDATVHLHEQPQMAGRHVRSRLSHLRQHFRHELLPPEPWLDRHDQQRVELTEHFQVGLETCARLDR